MLLFIGKRTIFCIKIRLVCESRHGYHDYVVLRAKMRALAQPFSLDMLLHMVRHIILKHLSIMFLSVTYPQNNNIRLKIMLEMQYYDKVIFFIFDVLFHPCREKKIPS